MEVTDPSSEPVATTPVVAGAGAAPVTAAPPLEEIRAWWRDHSVLYPDRYAWYVLVSVMDITVTVSVLVHYGAREVNSIAQASIELFGTWGLIGLKFLTLAIVVAICEYIGRKRQRLGGAIATIAVVASLSPVVAASVQVFWLWAHGELEHTEWPRLEP
jgi:uncharacterized membrane protein